MLQILSSSKNSKISVGRNHGLGFISPVVAKIARENNLDLHKISGTGQEGRITKNDVLAYIENRKGTDPFAITSETTKGSTELQGKILQISPVRKAIADHMLKSIHTSPHVTTVMEVDLKRIVDHRKESKVKFAMDGINLTYTAYFIAAASTALKSHPIANSSWVREGIQIYSDINIGMATSLGESGLIVPVIRNADRLSLLGLARTINELAVRTRSNQLIPEDVQGGTFTITNHGTSGSLFATPIINQPQCCILGIGMIQNRVIAIDESIAIRPMVYLSLSFDHRILDGTVADQFLSTVVESLQNWS